MFNVAYIILTAIVLILMTVGLSKAIRAGWKNREDLIIDVRE
jgi:uncharacterized membrane protein YsdA (DUF1294 family)